MYICTHGYVVLKYTTIDIHTLQYILNTGSCNINIVVIVKVLLFIFEPERNIRKKELEKQCLTLYCVVHNKYTDTHKQLHSVIVIAKSVQVFVNVTFTFIHQSVSYIVSHSYVLSNISFNLTIVSGLNCC